MSTGHNFIPYEYHSQSIRPLPLSRIAMMGCHNSPQTSSAPGSRCTYMCDNLPQIPGKPLYHIASWVQAAISWSNGPIYAWSQSSKKSTAYGSEKGILTRCSFSFSWGVLAWYHMATESHSIAANRKHDYRRNEKTRRHERLLPPTVNFWHVWNILLNEPKEEDFWQVYCLPMEYGIWANSIPFFNTRCKKNLMW
jgi:hypothetical protein